MCARGRRRLRGDRGVRQRKVGLLWLVVYWLLVALGRVSLVMC